MKKEVKDTIITELGQKLQEFPHFYLVDLTGLNAEKTSALRRKCFQNEIKMVVVKNTLLHKAFEASDIDFSELYGSLKGTTAVMFTNVANVPAKLLKEYEKDGRVLILAPESMYGLNTLSKSFEGLERMYRAGYAAAAAIPAFLGS